MDLAEVPTDMLMAEVQRRYDVFFAVGVRDRLPGESEDRQFESNWVHGEQLRLLGLVARAGFRLLYEIHADSDRVDEDGDITGE